MKKLRQVMLAVLCLFVMLGTVACGSNNNTNDMLPNDNNMNDATEGNYNNGNGVVDDIGDAVGNGVNDIGNGIKVITGDMTDNQRK